MSREKLFDDLSGMANGLAGLANDALNHARAKAEKFQNTMNAATEIEILKARLTVLESRVAALEKAAKPSSAQPETTKGA